MVAGRLARKNKITIEPHYGDYKVGLKWIPCNPSLLTQVRLNLSRGTSKMLPTFGLRRQLALGAFDEE